VTSTVRCIGGVALLVLTASCASSRLHREGLVEFEDGRYEEGLDKLQQAARQEPGNLDYRVELKARHDDAVIKLLGQADRARGAAKLDEAERLYARVLTIEPGNDRAQRGLDNLAGDRRHSAAIERAIKEFKGGDLERAESTVSRVLAEDPGYAAAVALRTKIDQARGPVSSVPHLKNRDARPVSLQFRDANTKMVFEVLSRQTGVNFVFDKDVRSDSKTTIFAQGVPVEQAIDLVIGQNQLARQVVSDNMVLIYPNTPAKQKEYQDEIVKTFYLTNTDPKKAQDLLKTVLNTKTLFVDDKASLIIMRDTPEAVRMAEKLINSLDLADSEVMMEVEVLEITRSNLQQLGIEYPTSATIATPSQLTLESIRHLGRSDISITPFSLTADLLKQVGRANTLASPRIRARNREKAKILIGSRVPVITNSVTPSAVGTPVVTGSVQYLDVGLTLEVEPTVHLDGEVSIKLNLEVSSITKEVDIAQSGTRAYEIGTRNAQTLLSLHDGETQILAGLIQDSDTRNSSHIPGLGDIPIVGKLFGSDHIDKEKTEIVLSITPRIIRSAARPSSETTEFWYGTESNLRSAPLGVQYEAAAASGAATGGARSTTGNDVPPATAAQTEAEVGASPGGDGPVPAEPTDPPVLRAKTQLEPDPSLPTVSFAGPVRASVGQPFDVIVRLAAPQPLLRVSAQVHFDGAVLQLDGVEPAEIIPSSAQGGAPRINQRAGVAQYVVAATKESPVAGDGAYMVLHFRPLTISASTPVSVQFAAMTTDGRPARLNLPNALSVAVAP
jgi:general secretion pathway protein D